MKIISVDETCYFHFPEIREQEYETQVLAVKLHIAKNLSTDSHPCNIPTLV